MSDVPMHVEINCETGEVTERPYTQEEIEAQAAIAAQYQAEKAAREAEAARIADLKTSARAKLVAGQPLTEEEAATIVL